MTKKTHMSYLLIGSVFLYKRIDNFFRLQPVTGILDEEMTN
jgi:hypothetical protein